MTISTNGSGGALPSGVAGTGYTQEQINQIPGLSQQLSPLINGTICPCNNMHFPGCLNAAAKLINCVMSNPGQYLEKELYNTYGIPANIMGSHACEALSQYKAGCYCNNSCSYGCKYSSYMPEYQQALSAANELENLGATPAQISQIESASECRFANKGGCSFGSLVSFFAPAIIPGLSELTGLSSQVLGPALQAATGNIQGALTSGLSSLASNAIGNVTGSTPGLNQGINTAINLAKGNNLGAAISAINGINAISNANCPTNSSSANAVNGSDLSSDQTSSTSTNTGASTSSTTSNNQNNSTSGLSATGALDESKMIASTDASGATVYFDPSTGNVYNSDGSINQSDTTAGQGALTVANSGSGTTVTSNDPSSGLSALTTGNIGALSGTTNPVVSSHPGFEWDPTEQAWVVIPDTGTNNLPGIDTLLVDENGNIIDKNTGENLGSATDNGFTLNSDGQYVDSSGHVIPSSSQSSGSSGDTTSGSSGNTTSGSSGDNTGSSGSSSSGDKTIPVSDLSSLTPATDSSGNPVYFDSSSGNVYNPDGTINTPDTQSGLSSLTPTSGTSNNTTTGPSGDTTSGSSTNSGSSNNTTSGTSNNTTSGTSTDSGGGGGNNNTPLSPLPITDPGTSTVTTVEVTPPDETPPSDSTPPSTTGPNVPIKIPSSGSSGSSGTSGTSGTTGSISKCTPFVALKPSMIRAAPVADTSSYSLPELKQLYSTLDPNLASILTDTGNVHPNIIQPETSSTSDTSSQDTSMNDTKLSAHGGRITKFSDGGQACQQASGCQACQQVCMSSLIASLDPSLLQMLLGNNRNTGATPKQSKQQQQPQQPVNCIYKQEGIEALSNMNPGESLSQEMSDYAGGGSISHFCSGGSNLLNVNNSPDSTYSHAMSFFKDVGNIGKPDFSSIPSPLNKVHLANTRYGIHAAPIVQNQTNPSPLHQIYQGIQGHSRPMVGVGGMAEGGLPAKHHPDAPKGHHPEFITGETGYYAAGRGTGQSDDIPAMLRHGDYVIDAETVAQLGDGSSKAGAHSLESLRRSIPVRHSEGGTESIPAQIADGEYVLPEPFVTSLGGGSNKKGAQMLDHMRERLREHKRSAPLDKIPPKAKSPMQYMRMKG